MDLNHHEHTEVVLKEEARKRLLKGMTLAAEAIGCTLGPKGKTVLIQQEGSAPVATKDGVTVSKAIKLTRPIERMGAELIREAASQTNDAAGDGTTTATVLTHTMVSEGLRLLAAGYSSLNLCKGIEIGTAAVIQALRESAVPVKTSSEIAQVGTVSANGDEVIGQLIADAMDQVGRDGIITVDDAKGMQTTMNIVEGMQFSRGYLSPFFVTNNDKMAAFYNDCRVLVTDKKVTTLMQIVGILEAVVQSGQKLLIIADEVEGEALNALVLNRVKNNLSIVAIKAPGYGNHRHDLLLDICKLTGARLISSKMGSSLEDADVDDLGRCKSVAVTARDTTLIGNGSTKCALDHHVAELKAQLEDVTLSSESISLLSERIARLAGGVAVIKVGGATEVEMIEKKYRIEDALHATRAAADEGIVPGGGTALFSAALQLSQLDLDDAEMAGVQIVGKACLAPLSQIASNAGKSPDVILDSLRRGLSRSDIQHRGYDAASDRELDMVCAGIIDPVKVTRTAIQNAASVAITFLTLDAVIFNVKEMNDAE